MTMPIASKSFTTTNDLSTSNLGLVSKRYVEPNGFLVVGEVMSTSMVITER